jgi:hypothetical protein
MWRETDRFLDSLAQSVREGKRVTEASNFARWLLFSGLLSFLQENKDPQSSLPFDPDALRKKADKLIYECGELFRGGKHDPKYAASDIAEINRKLDLLLSGSAGRSSDEPVALRLPEQNESGLCERVIQFIPDGLPTGGRPVDNGKSYEAHSRLASC